MTENINIKSALSLAAEKVEKALTAYLNEKCVGDTVCAQAMRYSTLGGGKRIRAYLAIEFCRLFGGDEKSAIPFACALECIHAYSLIHDDLPCMDNDDMRRGKPSCHIAFGEAEALLAGDGLLTYAFELAAGNDEVSPLSVKYAVAELARDAGILGMVGGQTLDIADTVADYEELMRIYSGKTSALIRAACMLGYYAATDKPKAEDIENIAIYAEDIGIAFQIQDDILDVMSDTATLGKTVGSDEKNNKKNVLSFMSMEEAQRENARLTDEAVEAVMKYEGGETLAELAKWLMSRNK